MLILYILRELFYRKLFIRLQYFPCDSILRHHISYIHVFTVYVLHTIRIINITIITTYSTPRKKTPYQFKILKQFHFMHQLIVVYYYWCYIKRINVSMHIFMYYLTVKWITARATTTTNFIKMVNLTYSRFGPR